jgi:diguanylate cyclase (GGDEF)-like protein/PAS domain S-box-containing protein
MREAARLETQQELALDQFSGTDAFGRITMLAATVMSCPVAAISITEDDRQWFLGLTGLEASELSRGTSFCTFCINSDSPLLVLDAADDPRFAESSLVTGAPHIRSYLGLPVHAENEAVLGTLSVMSTEPRAFRIHDIPILETLVTMIEQTLASQSRSLQLKRAANQLKELNMVFKQAEGAANIGSWRVDLIKDKLYWSDQVYAIHGLERDAKIDVENAINFYEPEDRQVVRDALAKTLDTGEGFTFDAKIRRPDGELRWIRSIGERIDVDGRPEAVAGIFLDCTEERLKTLALEEAAKLDRLTGLFNRAGFDARLAEAMAGEPGQVITAMLLDLDGFKYVNDTLGHLIGDRLLIELAERLKEVASEDVFVARWGGDEFAFLFPPDTCIEAATKLAHRIVGDVSRQVDCGSTKAIVGGTCGIAQICAPASSEELVRRADVALYHGKTTGRGSVYCWDKTIEGSLLAQQRAVAQLTSALENDMTLAAYQPIVNLATGCVAGAEALLRLVDHEGAMIPAAEVFPALLEPSLSKRVFNFMINRVFAEADAFFERHGKNCRITINVTESDLRTDAHSAGFLQIVQRAVAKGRVNPRNFAFEITETMLLLDDSGDIRTTLKELEAMGFAIALDDFGTGFSSLTHLRDFPIQLVKIDRDFIAQIATSHQSRLIIRAIVQIADSLGLKAVAEGVETPAQVDYLLSVGCHFAQGYLFGRPSHLSECAIPQQVDLGLRKFA